MKPLNNRHFSFENNYGTKAFRMPTNLLSKPNMSPNFFISFKLF